MTCNCPDCRPAPKCRSHGCKGTPAFNERGYCRDCADERADMLHDAAKDERAEREAFGDWDY